MTDMSKPGGDFETPPPPYTDKPPEGQPGYPPPAAGYPPGQYQQGYGASPGYPAGPYPNTGQYPPPMQSYGQPAYVPQGYQYANVVVAQPMGYQVQSGPPPPDHMCAAILVTLLCFWPTGIVAIMRASDARSALARNDIVSAQSYASSAKSMITISIVIGIICFAVVAVIVGIYIGVILQNIRDYD